MEGGFSGHPPVLLLNERACVSAVVDKKTPHPLLLPPTCINFALNK